jgi:hypothetical protein
VNPGETDSATDPLGEVRRALRTAHRELRWLLIEHEHNLESLQRVRRQRAKLRAQAEDLATALAESRSAAYWAQQAAPARSVRRMGRAKAADPEADLVREVEADDLFDGGWYLRTHPKAVRSGLSPALHYVRHGNAGKLDPGPKFRTAAYLERHPEVADGDLPALLHATRRGNPGETTVDDAESSPAPDVLL